MSEIKKLLKEKFKAIEQGQFKEAAAACNAIGEEYSNQEKYDDALQQHVEELEYCEMTGDELGIAVANRKIGECYCNLNNFKKALVHIKKYYDLSVKLKSDLEEQRAWATFGRTYYLKYLHESASETHHKNSETLVKAELANFKAQKLLHNLSSTAKPVELADMKCRILLNLGLIYEVRGNLTLSSKYVKEAFDISIKNSLYEIIHKSGCSLGSLYQKIGKHVETEHILNETLKATKKLHNKTLTCEVLLSKGINLICLENYAEAKKCLKSAYKMSSTKVEDFDKIVKSLKVCIGVEKYEKKLKTCTEINERKLMFETIADALSSIKCYKLAIKKYILTLDCITDEDKKAPIYYSIGQTYLDDGDIPKALEYFEKEYSSNRGKPLEQVATVLKMAEILESRNNDKCEELYLKAVSLSEVAGDPKVFHTSLSKLYSFYNSNNRTDCAEDVRKKLDSVHFEDNEEENEDEESQDPFTEIHLSELSDSDEEVAPRGKRAKRIEAKVNEKGETPLQQACIEGNLKKVKRLVENGHPVNVKDFGNWTPLHEACNYGYYEIVEYLIENGADVNVPGGPGGEGMTPLLDAALMGHLDIIQLLVSKGASVVAIDKTGKYPLDGLLQWKEENLDLDDTMLKQYKAVVELLKSKMAEAGVSINNLSLANVSVADSSDVERRHVKTGEKRNRSPNISSESSSSEEIDDDTPPYFSLNANQIWNEDAGAAEYRCVMEGLRRSAADLPLAKSQPSKVTDAPALLNEDEVVNEWLIKDTVEIPRTKKNRRKRNKLNVRTSKRIDNYLISQDSVEGSKDSIMHNEDSNISISSVSSADISCVSKSPVQPVQVESSMVAYCVRVNIDGKVILIPVPDDTCTVSWLKEEAATRYENLDGRKPCISVTKNGALLTGTDLVKSIFSNNEEVLSSVEKWEEPSLEDKYVQLCSKRNAPASSFIKKRLQSLEKSGELDFSNSFTPQLHFSIILGTVLNYENLQHVNFSGTTLSSAHMNDLVAWIPNSPALITLNLSCCGLTSQSIEVFVDYLCDQLGKNSVLPSLKILDLSFNLFASFLHFDVFFRLNSLVSLDLGSCNLDSTFLSNELLEAVSQKHNLENLDISGNLFNEDDILKYLHHLPKNSLKKLNLKFGVCEGAALGFKLRNFFSETMPNFTELILQGCHLTDTDVNQIAQNLFCCKELQIVNLDDNPSLSSNSINNFINQTYKNNLPITEISIIATCVWEGNNFSTLENFLKLHTLRKLTFNDCPVNLMAILVQKWTEKWSTKAVWSNDFFCELNIK